MQFLSETHKAIRCVVLRTNLQRRYIGDLFLLPWNWPRFAFRANVMADTIRGAWAIHGKLRDLPAAPVWAINGTTMETGRRWRFRGDAAPGRPPSFEMGDGELGYTPADDFPIASAMATSAAFPGGISPLRISTRKRAWTKPNYDAPGHPLQNVQPRYGAYHVADGGVYDNLGLEPLFDVSRNAIRGITGCDYLVVSDGGAPLPIKRWHLLAQAAGFAKRTVDIMSTQTRHLRVRAFARFLIENPGTGVFLDISQAADEAISRARNRYKVPVPLNIERYPYLREPAATIVAEHATTLGAPSAADFELIERHGYEVTLVQFGLYG